MKRGSDQKRPFQTFAELQTAARNQLRRRATINLPRQTQRRAEKLDESSEGRAGTEQEPILRRHLTEASKYENLRVQSTRFYQTLVPVVNTSTGELWFSKRKKRNIFSVFSGIKPFEDLNTKGQEKKRRNQLNRYPQVWELSSTTTATTIVTRQKKNASLVLGSFRPDKETASTTEPSFLSISCARGDSALSLVQRLFVLTCICTLDVGDLRRHRSCHSSDATDGKSESLKDA